MSNDSLPDVARPERIISGGQTGVDRGALDAAMLLGIPHGGWCPRGRLAEDGRIPKHYRLAETPSRDYAARTEQNVVDSDATLILCRGPLRGGTKLTRYLTTRHDRPCLVVDLDAPPPKDEIHQWLQAHKVAVLNVAGPRESQRPGIGVAAATFIGQLFADC